VMTGNFQSGGSAGIASGTVVTALTVAPGETLFVSSGGTANALTISAGGYAELLSGGAAGGVTFAGVSATLLIASGGQLTGVLTGFEAKDQLALGGISYGAGTTYTYSGTTLSGTLTVTDGVHNASIQFVGNYNATDFTDGAAAGGGTVIGYS